MERWSPLLTTRIYICEDSTQRMFIPLWALYLEAPKGCFSRNRPNTTNVILEWFLCQTNLAIGSLLLSQQLLSPHSFIFKSNTSLKSLQIRSNGSTQNMHGNKYFKEEVGGHLITKAHFGSYKIVFVRYCGCFSNRVDPPVDLYCMFLRTDSPTPTHAHICYQHFKWLGSGRNSTWDLSTVI